MNDAKKVRDASPTFVGKKKTKISRPQTSQILPPLAMIEESAYFYKIIEAVPANIFWKDIYGRYLGCNSRVLRLTNFTCLDEFVGKTDFDFPWAYQAEALKKLDDKVIRLKKTLVNRESVTIDGRTHYYFSSKSPLFNQDHQVIGVIGVSQEITEQIRAENRAKRAQTKEKEANKKVVFEKEFRESAVILAGSIAHDLKNPLSGMLIYSDLINHALASMESKISSFADPQCEMGEVHHLFSQLQSWNEKMQKNIQDMSSFINTTMSSISRLLTDSLTEEDYTLCEIEPCLNDIIHHYPFKPNEKQLIHLGIQHNFQFLGNSVLIYRVIANLVNNALRQIHLQKRGEIYLTTEENKNFNLVKIRDTAGNVAAEKIKNIFSTYKDKSHQNTGIGLKFCKLTMQSFGGDITCEVVDGGYIEFTLHFAKVENESVNNKKLINK